MHAVGVDQARGSFVAITIQWFPCGKVRFEQRREFVAHLVGGISDQLDARGIEMLQQAF